MRRRRVSGCCNATASREKFKSKFDAPKFAVGELPRRRLDRKTIFLELKKPKERCSISISISFMLFLASESSDTACETCDNFSDSFFFFFFFFFLLSLTVNDVVLSADNEFLQKRNCKKSSIKLPIGVVLFEQIKRRKRYRGTRSRKRCTKFEQISRVV